MRLARGVRTAVLAALALLGPLAGAGCRAVDETQQVLDRADLVNDLASRLARANELTYTAEYQLASGKTATVAQAQRPLRSAYAYPGGQVVINNTATAACRARGSGALCTLTPPPLSSSGPPAGVLDAAIGQGLVDPTVVMGLLTAAALDTDVKIEQSGSTIAGRPATCVAVSQLADAASSAFTACITADGVLGGFRGDLRGRPVEVSLVSYTGTAAEDSFQLPAGARVTDQRAR